MDEEEIYDQLSDRIRQVFDNYDEDTSADDSWALLRQKFPEEEKRRSLPWLWYAAAVVLLCLGVWFMYQPGDHKKLMVKTSQPGTTTDKKDHAMIDTMNVSPTPAKDGLAKSKVQQPAIAPVQITPVPQINNALTVAKAPKSSGKMPLAVNSPQLPNALASANKTRPAASPANTSLQNGTGSSNITPSVIAVAQPKVNVKDPANDKLNPADVLVNNTVAGKQPDTAVSNNRQYVAANKQAETVKPTTTEALNKLLSERAITSKPVKTTSKGTVLSVFAATYFNYAKGSDNNINVGAGFGSDFRISNKLKLSTGLAITQNSLNYANGTVTTSGLYNTGATASADPASAALNQAAYNTSSKTGFVSAVIPVLQNYSASLVGLDVPINLKYLFDPQKSETYVSAGLSSGTFINETYVLNYTSAQLAQKSTTHTSFNNFDFAKTLNVSFGVGYPLGKSNRLIIEPFLKYPLDGLGSQQIKFGAGGVNLKLNFTPTKK